MYLLWFYIILHFVDFILIFQVKNSLFFIIKYAIAYYMYIYKLLYVCFSTQFIRKKNMHGKVHRLLTLTPKKYCIKVKKNQYGRNILKCTFGW